jgi:hypothetical protein
MVNSREKGARAEREVGHILVEFGYLGGKRGQQRSGLEQADVVGLPGWHLEAKRTERFALWEFWEQVRRDAARSGDRPVLVTRRSNSPWLAVVEFRAFLGLLNRIEDLEQELALTRAKLAGTVS